MASKKIYCVLPILVSILLGGCASTQETPLADHITLIPVSDKADIESGLKMDYFYGANEQALNYISCHPDGSCLYSGHDFRKDKKDDSELRVNSLVIHTTKGGKVAWARTYLIGDNYYNTLGMIPATDGGALLYGNALISTESITDSKPAFEKIAANGNPEWGGTLNQWVEKDWAAFNDGIRLPGGGYVLSGSNEIGNKWYGLVLRISSSGKEVWFSALRSRDQPTLVGGIIELKNGDILAAGYNGTLHDLALFELGPKGEIKKAPIIHIKGDEFPVGLINLTNSVGLIASEEMPSGESAAIVIRLSQKLRVLAASRYRYSDGFNPYGAIALPDGELCLYGSTKANAESIKQSLAFTVNKKTIPDSAIILKGEGIFNSGTRLSGNELIFDGGRELGVHQHVSSIVVSWNPSLMDKQETLAKIRRGPIKLTEYSDESAKQWLTTKSDMKTLKLKEMSSRLVFGSAAAGRNPASAKKASSKP